MKKIVLALITTFVFFSYTNAQVDFQPHTIIDQGSTNGPRAVFAADLDGDGLLDMVSVSEYDSKIAWYKNDGSGNLGAQQIISLDIIAPVEAHAKDIDGDDNIDILVASSENSKIVWFKNDGSANFGAPRIITENVNGYSNAIAEDIDGDGDLDVVVTSANDNKIAWYENTNGLGTFGSEIIITTTLDRIVNITASDLDTDGDIDIIASTVYGDKTVWFKNLDGLGTFGNELLVDDDITSTYSLYGFDIDADGDNDIITSEYNSLNYYENLNGQGNFSTERILITGDTSYFLFEDIDQDGDMDIISAVGQEIAWYENLNGQGNFGNKQILATTQHINELNMADINGDGNLDILTAKFIKDEISWYPSIGQGTYGNERILSIVDGAQGAYSVQAADIDGDGNMDAVSGNIDAETITWYRNIDGQGTFGPPIIVGANIQYVQSIYVADLNGDGDMDIVSSSDENNLATWYKNVDGQGSFEAQQPFSTNFDSPMFVTSNDLDNDGDMDVIVWDFNFGMAWFKNLDGLGNFGQAQTIDGTLRYTESIYIVDLNGDGYKDIITASFNDQLFAWYENLDGQGNFSTQNIIEENLNGAIEIYYSDIDGDGDMDILGSLTGEDMVVWYENIDGLGTFGPRKIITNIAPFPEGIRTLDADQDGDLDVFITDYRADTVSWYENMDGLGNFGPQQLIDTNMNGVLSIDIADFDGNGKMDLLAGAWLGDKLKWYENLGPLSVEENTSNLITLYPVPSNDVLNVKSSSKIVEAIVYNELGQRLLNVENMEGINSLDIAALSNGIYFITLKDFDQNNVTKKFIKQE